MFHELNAVVTSIDVILRIENPRDESKNFAHCKIAKCDVRAHVCDDSYSS